jgi:hypothetical protein
MAINKNHEFEEINGIKCGIVERNVSASRVAFIKEILTANGYTVEIVPSSPMKGTAETLDNTTPATFTVGVSDYTFNTINAIFGRLLKTKNGEVVTLAYWQQKDAVNRDDIPYFEN